MRQIAGSRRTPVTAIAIAVQRCLRLVIVTLHQVWKTQWLIHTGRTPSGSWILNKTQDYPTHLRGMRQNLASPHSQLTGVKGLQSRDYTALYPSIPHDDCIAQLTGIVHMAFRFENKRKDISRNEGQDPRHYDAFITPGIQCSHRKTRAKWHVKLDGKENS